MQQLSRGLTVAWVYCVFESLFTALIVVYTYLQDVLGVLQGEKVKLTLADSNSSALLEEMQDDDSVYVVMPMKL